MQKMKKEMDSLKEKTAQLNKNGSKARPSTQPQRGVAGRTLNKDLIQEAD